MSRFSYKTLFIILLFLLIPIVILLRLNQKPQTALAGWWNDTWSYRSAININNAGVGQTNVYITLTIGTSDTSRFKANAGDIRFTTPTSVLLPYYLVSGVGTSSTVIHVNFPTLPVGNSTIYLYYGNPSAANGFSAADFSTAAASTTPTPAAEEIGGGPVAWWKFDEGVGTTVYDSSSNGNNGTFGSGNSSPAWTTEDQCVSNKCLKFDGTNDYVATTDVGDNTTSLTISVWAKPTIAHNGYFVAKDDVSSNRSFVFGVTDTNDVEIYFQTATGYDYSTSGNLKYTANQWTNFTAVYINGVTKIYINGQESTVTFIANTASGAISNNNLITDIGRRVGAAQHYFNGYLDDVKIYPYARTATQIKQDYVTGLAGMSTAQGANTNIGSNSQKSLSDGLVGYWKFDEGVGTTSADSSGNSNLATFGAGSSAPSWSNGKYGVGLSFGGGQYADIPDANIANFYSYGAWVNPTTTNSNAGIIGDWQDSADGSMIYISAGNVPDCRQGGNGAIATATSAIPTSSWTHIFCVWNNNQLTIYINGIGVSSAPATSYNDGGNFNIGRYGTGPFTGLIDEVRIYNRALNPTEVKTLYNYAPGPVAYWKFDEGTGITAYDSSGNGWTTNITNATYTNGKYGKALSFGSGKSAAVSNFTTSPGGLTIGFWVYTRTYNADYSWPTLIMATWGTWAVHTFSTASGSGGAICAGIDVGSRICTSAGYLPIGQWAYITLTYDSSGHKLYKNGVLTDSNQNTAIINYPHNLTMGSSFEGSIDDVKIFNYARTQQQIISDMNAGSSPVSAGRGAVAYYKFDEGQGTVAANWGIGGTALNATLGPGSSSPTWTNSGKVNQALSFNGSSNYLSVGSTIANVQTISFWINPNSVTNNYFLTLGSSVSVGATSNTLFTNGFTSPSIYINGVGTSLLISNVWQHVVISTGITITADAIQIGKNGNSYFNGYIDEVKIYNYALSSDEVKTDYNQGSSAVLGSNKSNSSQAALVPIVADTFSRADGSLTSTETFGMSWSGSTWTISGNKVLNTPNIGTSEVLSNPSFETGNPPTGWSIVQGTPTTFEQSSTQAQDGTYSLHFVTDHNNECFAQSPTLPTNTWYISTGYMYPTISGDYTNFGISTDNTFIYLPLNQWSKLTTIGPATAGQRFNICTYNNRDSYFDNVSLRSLTLPELFATVPSGQANVSVETSITLENQTLNRIPAGLVLRLDNQSNPQNFLTVSVEGYGANNWGRIIMKKFTNNAYSTLFANDLYYAGTNYAAGRKLKAVLKGSLIKIYYNNVLINTTTVSDTAIVNNTIHGLFSTYPGNTFDNFNIQASTNNYDYCIPGDTTACSPPAAEWKFEEGVGTTAFDTSGNGNNSALGPGSSAPTWAIGKIGTALSFNGSTNYLNLGTFNSNSGSYTFNFWTKSNASPTTNSFLFDSQSGRLVIGWNGTTSGKIGYYDSSNSWRNTNVNAPNDNQWHYLSYVLNAGTSFGTIYVDGIGQTSLPYQSTNIGTLSAIGSRYDQTNPYFFNGSIDQVQIYNYARSPAQIAWDYNGGKPIGWWKMDECQGSIVYDWSGIGNTGSITIGAGGSQVSLGTCQIGDTSAWSNGKTGKINSSLNFDGTDDYVDTPNRLLNDNSALTYSAWIKFSVSQKSKTIVGRHNDATGGSSLGIDDTADNKIKFHLNSWTSQRVNSTMTLNDNTWHHIVGTWDTTNLKLYVDGVLNASSQPATTLTYPALNTQIGRWVGGSSQYFNGQIDDVRIYNYALTATQVKTLYNGGAVNFQ